MYNPNADESPFNPLPTVVIALAMVISAVEIVLQAGESGLVGGPGAIGWRIDAMQDYAFIPALWDAMLQQGLFPLEHMMRFVTYPFIHGSFTHAAFAVVIVLAIGKVVGEVFSTFAFLAMFFVSAIFGALVMALITDSASPLVGAYPGAYGLIGGFTFLLWVQLTQLGQDGKSAFTLVGVLLGIQLVFAMIFGGGLDWIADLAGFISGFLLSFIVSPGGWARVLAKLRKR
ncbi:MAG: rhomboid family intramembrane serine protease [Litoreibacter sp.]|nr:rhomboid family intramembrane serine protease [Litoreibacter sp.]